MSMQSLEREIRDRCSVILQNRKLRHDDIQEWSTSKDSVLKDLLPEKEVFVELPTMGIYCAVLKTADKRPQEATNAN